MRAIYRITFLFIFCSTSVQVVAQNFYNKSGTTVSISTNGIISVKDSLINEGTLINNGNMAVGGTWLNLGTYDAGDGQITFNSTDTSKPQVINHNSQSFSKLVISGGGIKQILADLTVEESLTLTDGIITAQNGSRVHFSPAAAITGGSDDSHINAPVYQQGTGTKLFPVGNGTAYLPVEINGITTDSEIGITLIELQAGETLNRSSSVDAISDKRYWAVDLASGSLNGTRITLPVEGDEGLDPLKNNEFVVAFAENASGDFTSIGRSQNSTALLVQNELALGEGIVTLAVVAENQSIVVFNAISPNSDDEINNYIHIDNLVEGDVVSIYNRWGDLVFEMKNYDNDETSKRFNGQSNVGGGKDLPTGNYFYVIRRKAGKEVSGYLSLRK
jgi:gliding motility-associated-like protein